MNNPNLIVRSTLAVALAMAVWAPAHALAAEPVETKEAAAAKMMEQCQEMKAQKAKLKADRKAQDAELTEQMATMNSAPQDKKLDLLAAITTHRMEQRIAMDARKDKMEEEMMQHMMQHMQMGKESMAMCPMMKGMKGMKGMDDTADDAHHDHH